MRIAKAFIAITMLTIFSASIIVGSPLNVQPSKMVSLQSTKSIAFPQINIMNKVMPYANRYNESLYLTANITQLGKEICGLNKSNFRLDTPLLSINGVYNLQGPTSNYPNSNCFYDIDILPAVYQGKQYTWSPAKGYAFKFNLSYISNGQVLASKTITLNETTVRELLMSGMNPSQPNSVVVVKR